MQNSQILNSKLIKQVHNSFSTTCTDLKFVVNHANNKAYLLLTCLVKWLLCLTFYMQYFGLELLTAGWYGSFTGGGGDGCGGGRSLVVGSC